MKTAPRQRPANEVSPQPADLKAHGAITFLTVPVPPSTNALFKNVRGRGRAKTAEYQAWLDRAGWVLKSQRPVPVDGRVMVIINIDRPNQASDVDNRVKALFDLLGAHKVIQNDKRVTAFAIAWAPKGTGVVRLAIMPAVDITLDFQLHADGVSGGWFLRAPEQQEPATYGD